MLEQNISRFKRKYYLNKLIKGGILAIALLLASFLFINIIEYFGNFDTPLRAMLFYSFLLTAGISLTLWVFEPLSRLLMPQRQISDHDAADRIGQHFPQIKDKLVNTLQLSKVDGGSMDLVQASLMQRGEDLAQFHFDDAIDIGYNRKYLKYLLIPFFIILGVFLWQQDFFSQTTTRLIQYDQKFVPQAPFQFQIEEGNLSAFKGEDFELKLATEGSQAPAQATIMTADGRRLKMTSQKTGVFTYNFKKLQKTVDFYVEAAGFHSKSYQLQVVARPNLRGFSVFLDYPSYVNKKDERINNTGNFIVPEGTNITWQFQSQAAEELAVKFARVEKPEMANSIAENTFEFSKVARQSDSYEVELRNEYSKNKETIAYYLNVVKDEHPNISLKQVQDTTLYDYLLFGGNIGDDYGITGLNLRYQVMKAGQVAKENTYQTVKIPFNADLINQSFFHKIALKDIELKQGEYVSYFVEVWDNDGINGRKRSKTSAFQFKFPSKSELNEKIAVSAKKAEKKMDDVLKEAKDLDKDLKELQDRLKGKKKLDWKDKKAIEDLVEKREDLEKKVESMQQSNQELQEKFQKFNETSPELAEKAEQLQKLMDEILDDETKELYHQLEELLDKNMMDEDLLEQLEKINMSQENMEMELERSIELFKRLKFDMKAEQVAKDLEKLSKKEEELSKESKENSDKQGEDLKEKSEDLQKKQEELNKEFEELEKDMKEMDDMNKGLEQPKDLDDINEEKKEAKDEMEKSKQELGEQQPKKASESQKKAAEKMQEMAEQLQQMQQSAEMQEMTENYEDLRQILENLMTLSFDQEDLMKEFRSLRRNNPKFIELGQKQLKLQADARIIEDSLVALSQRVFQIESFVTRELGDMKNYMKRSVEVIRQRPPDVGPAAAKEQQLTMTSVNNLALMLDNVLEQMQQQMSGGMGGKQMNEKSGNMPSMSQLQQQLNQQINNLKKSGKSGRQLSEELAKLAAQQEMIRRAIQSAQKGQQGGPGMPGGKPGGKDGEGGGKMGPDGKPLDGDGGKEGKDGDGGNKALERLMEQTEEDLVNKRITAETLKRQKQIMTRLLESEKSMRERELDKKREAESAKGQRDRKSPDAFSEYLKQKEKQIELLKTIPASLKPYYKKEVDKYFKKVGQ